MGYICIAIALASLICRNKYLLLYAAVFLSGFTGSSVVTINGDISIQPSYILFFIYALFSVKDIFKAKFDPVYLIFLVYCIIGSFLPALLSNNDIVVMLQNGKYGAVSYSTSNLIHVLYLSFTFVFFAYLTAIKKDKIKSRIFKAYKYGLFAFILVVVYQIFAFEFDLPFDEIFRQNVDGNIQGTRLYGPCGEASMMAYYLAPSLLFLWISKDSVFDLIMFFVGSILGFLSCSSTFFVGYCFILAFIVLRYLFDPKTRSKSSMAIAAVAVIVVILVAAFDDSDIVATAYNSLVDKLNEKNFSGMERADSFRNMFMIGVNYPFGVGFGTSRSKDLLSTWSCNIGIIGLLIFATMILRFYKKALKYNNPYIYIYILTVILMMIAVPEPYALFIQVLLYFGIQRRKTALI